MAKMTITEALGEIRTIQKRLLKKAEFIQEHLARASSMVDPLVGAGGSEKAVREARQAFGDLQERLILLRAAVQKSNLEAKVTVDNETRTVSEWFIIKRDVLSQRGQLLSQMSSRLSQGRAELAKHTQDSERDVQFISHVDEKDLAQLVEHHQKICGDVDTQLSLSASTVTISV